jgi:hypothetical protein
VVVVVAVELRLLAPNTQAVLVVVLATWLVELLVQHQRHQLHNQVKAHQVAVEHPLALAPQVLVVQVVCPAVAAVDRPVFLTRFRTVLVVLVVPAL